SRGHRASTPPLEIPPCSRPRVRRLGVAQTPRSGEGGRGGIQCPLTRPTERDGLRGGALETAGHSASRRDTCWPASPPGRSRNGRHALPVATATPSCSSRWGQRARPCLTSNGPKPSAPPV